MPETSGSQFESQRQRWFKYGLNVVVVSIVVIVLAGLITYMAQRANRRIDTTATGQYSLKPQTLNIIQNLKTPIKIVSLYQKPSADDPESQKMDYAQPVRDLLDEYRSEGKNITVDSIDPVANPTKVDDLINEVTNKYGGEIKKYDKVLDAYPDVYKQIEDIAAGEVTKVGKLPIDQLSDDDAGQTARAALTTINNIPQLLGTSRESIERKRKQKPPDLKGAVDSVSDNADLVSQRAAAVVQIFNQDKTDAKLPESIRAYMASATPVYEKLKKIADDLVKQAKDVGELKLDDLRQSLRARDAILVMGQKDMRVIPFEQVWKVDDRELKQYAPGQELKPQFAGEQQISTAILGLTQTSKPKVCFVRAGGAPLTTPGMPPFQPGGPMSTVAERLRQYNFDVSEKDLTGMWAMQAQMQQMPSAPEPSDDQIKDAVWVVMDFPTSEPQQGMPTPSIAEKVEQHLKEGGSALILEYIHGGALKQTLEKDFGIDVHPDAIAVHQLVEDKPGRQGNEIDQAQKIPYIFDIRDYGNDIITRPLRSLESLLAQVICVQPAAKAPDGVNVTPIIPIPNQPPSWGETNLEGSQGDLANIKYDAGTDLKGPIWGGAVAERQFAPSTQPAKGGKAVAKIDQRLVVIGTPTIALDQLVNMPDIELLRRGIPASKFPGNAELFCNSVYWLSHMEPLISISPAAMDVSRIASMSDSTLRAWRIGALIVGLPGLVILCGIGVFLARRD